MTWMNWERGRYRAGPRPRWKGWQGEVEVRTFAGGQHGDLLMLNDALLNPRAAFTVVGEGGEPDATIAFELRPLPEHPLGNPYLLTHVVKDVRPEVAELENVARAYREHIDTTPTRAVQLAGNYSERTAARRVQQARAAGLLPKTTPGKRKA